MMIPKGKLIAIGGSEAREESDSASHEQLQPVDFFNHGILQTVLQEIKGSRSKILVITAASEIPRQMAELYLNAFQLLGCRQIDL